MRATETNVWVSCDDCGRDRYAPHELTVRVNLDDETCTATWRCRKCGRANVTAIPSLENVGALVAAGTPVVQWRYPREITEVRRDATLTTADVEAATRLLNLDGALERAVEELDGPFGGSAA